MPKELEKSLAKAAKKKGLKGKRKAAYIYGTMNNMGVMKGNKMTKKGKKMDAKEMTKKMEKKHHGEVFMK